MCQNNKKTLQEEFLDWAKRVVDVYNPIAQSEQVNYYTQSDLNKLKESPELLLLGINPGSEGKDGKQLTNEEFLTGNPKYSNKDSWTMWQRLCRLFAQGNMMEMLQNEEEFVWSNVFHFNTKKERGLTNSMKAPEVVELTRNLIRILNPQRVLCLGGENCLYQLFPKPEITLEALIPGTLWYTKFGSTPIYGIPHTSSYYTNEQTNLLGKILAFLFNAPETEHTSETLESKFSNELQTYRERLKGSNEKVFLQEVGSIVKSITVLESSDRNNLIYLNEYVQALVAYTRDYSINISYRNKHDKTYPLRDEIVKLLKQRKTWNEKKYVPFRTSANKPEVLCNIRRLRIDSELKTYMSKENGVEELAKLISQEFEELAVELRKLFKD